MLEPLSTGFMTRPVNDIVSRIEWRYRNFAP